jgi:hypothetical protein
MFGEMEEIGCITVLQCKGAFEETPWSVKAIFHRQTIKRIYSEINEVDLKTAPRQLYSFA